MDGSSILLFCECLNTQPSPHPPPLILSYHFQLSILSHRFLLDNSQSLRDRFFHRLSSQTPFEPLKNVLSSSVTVAAATPFLSNETKINADGDAEVQKWDDNWDLRDPEFLGLTEYPKATRFLILIRHGQYHLEHDDDADRKLTELGREQLQLTGHRLKELSCQLNTKYDKIFVSNMTRALESADIIASLLPDVPRGKFRPFWGGPRCHRGR